MRRTLLLSLLVFSLAAMSARAGDHYYVPSPIAYSPSVAYYSAPVIYPSPVMVSPVVYTTRTVAYQPAYVVPTSTVVATYPVSGVVVGHSVYAPMVPTVYAPAVTVAPAYFTSPVVYRSRIVKIKHKRHWHFGY